jgi:hypothetical protein
MTERLCAHCGDPLVQRENERPCKFATRLTCNPRCGVSYGHKCRLERAMLLHGIDEAEFERRTAAGLCACGEPLQRLRFKTNKTCGKRECLGYAEKGFEDYADGERHVPWPVVTGPVVADFSPHEVDAPDGGWGRKFIRKDERSYTGCTAAYAMGVA